LIFRSELRIAASDGRGRSENFNKKIAQTLEISRELVGFIILDVLGMKLFAKLVPKCLNANQKRDCVVGS